MDSLMMLQKIKSEVFISDDDASKFFVNDEGNIVGFGHIDLIDKIHKPFLSEIDLEHMRAIYVYLAGFLFATDRLIDNQSKDQKSDILIGHSALVAAFEITNKISNRNAANKIISEISNLIKNNRFALIKEEVQRTKNTESDLIQDIESAHARGYLFMSAYKMSLYLKEIPEQPAFEMFSREFIYFMQEGDDLGDWREDFTANRITPMLRRCLNTIEKKSIAVADIEEYIYLSGFYEEQAERIANGLQKSLDHLLSLKNVGEIDSMTYFVSKQIRRIHFVKDNFSRVKEGLAPLALKEYEH